MPIDIRKQLYYQLNIDYYNILEEHALYSIGRNLLIELENAISDKLFIATRDNLYNPLNNDLIRLKNCYLVAICMKAEV